MKTITATATATTEKGTILNLTITASRGYEKIKETLYSDGWNTEVETMKKIDETYISIAFNGQMIEGRFLTGMFVSNDLKKQGIFATFGGKIAITERVYNELNSVCISAVKEAETDINWLHYQDMKAKSIKEEYEYEQHVKSIENAMTLNGRTY